MVELSLVQEALGALSSNFDLNKKYNYQKFTKSVDAWESNLSGRSTSATSDYSIALGTLQSDMAYILECVIGDTPERKWKNLASLFGSEEISFQDIINMDNILGANNTPATNDGMLKFEDIGDDLSKGNLLDIDALNIKEIGNVDLTFNDFNALSARAIANGIISGSEENCLNQMTAFLSDDTWGYITENKPDAAKIVADP